MTETNEEELTIKKVENNLDSLSKHMNELATIFISLGHDFDNFVVRCRKHAQTLGTLSDMLDRKELIDTKLALENFKVFFNQYKKMEKTVIELERNETD